ncbi:MAG TPA: DUF3105 domain-containing protein [Actinomycetota bacterium]|nr:DUF3105 domain-containing protein [Actinomycetota bacterium]
MAKKKKRRSPRPAPVATGPATGTPSRGGANVVRRERKEEARRLREAELRRARRSSALRRTVVSIGIAAGAVAVITLFRSVAGPNEIPETARAAARAAGCTEVVQPAATAPGDQHLDPGAPYDYEDPPASSGFHDPTWLEEPKVWDEQPPETRAVHSLEHGAVFAYYLPESSGGVSQSIVDRLAQLAQGDQATFVAPYPTLAADRALTLTAWNRRQSCPSGSDLTPERAATIVTGFVEAFECTSNAPEGSSPPC